MSQQGKSYSKKEHRHENWIPGDSENSYDNKFTRITRKSVKLANEIQASKELHITKGNSPNLGEPPDEGSSNDPETETVVVYVNV